MLNESFNNNQDSSFGDITINQKETMNFHWFLIGFVLGMVFVYPRNLTKA